MKFRLTFKTPDVLDQVDDLDCDTKIWKECVKTASMWMEHDEYITIEFDTETTTAIVVK